MCGRADVAQSVERRTLNPVVAGSSPVVGTFPALLAHARAEARKEHGACPPAQRPLERGGGYFGGTDGREYRQEPERGPAGLRIRRPLVRPEGHQCVPAGRVARHAANSFQAVPVCVSAFSAAEVPILRGKPVPVHPWNREWLRRRRSSHCRGTHGGHRQPEKRKALPVRRQARIELGDKGLQGARKGPPLLVRECGPIPKARTQPGEAGPGPGPELGEHRLQRVPEPAHLQQRVSPVCNGQHRKVQHITVYLCTKRLPHFFS